LTPGSLRSKTVLRQKIKLKKKENIKNPLGKEEIDGKGKKYQVND